MELTSARINKLIKALEVEKNALLEADKRDSTYTYSANEEPVIPAYNFSDTVSRIDTLNKRVMKLRHALNVFNSTFELTLGLTIDQALVRMAQLEQEKKRLTVLANAVFKKRERGYMASNPDYTVVNYCISEAKIALENVCAEIAQIQLCLDSTNCSELIPVELTEEDINDIHYAVGLK